MIQRMGIRLLLTPGTHNENVNVYKYSDNDNYPQIIHKPEHTTLDGSYINCTSFVDANGKTYTDWIPAIRIE